MNRLAVGTRVRLRADIDHFPDFIAPAGATGKVQHIGSGILYVRLDEIIVGAEHWFNDLAFTISHGDLLEESLEVLEKSST